MTIDLQDFVSRETMSKFEIYKQTLETWNRRTSLVQADTLPTFQTRHVVDSLQIIPIMLDILGAAPTSNFENDEPQNIYFKNKYFDSVFPFPKDLNASFRSYLTENHKKVEDLLSPYNTVPILDMGTGAGFPGMVLAMCGFTNVTLCESNQRKCLFLEEVARQTKTKVSVINERVENLKPSYEIIVSRACCSLDQLCKMMGIVSRETSATGIFHKGSTWKDEVKEAMLKWDFNLRAYQSITAEESVVLSIHNLREIKKL